MTTVKDIADRMKDALPPEMAPYVDQFINAERPAIQERLEMMEGGEDVTLSALADLRARRAGIKPAKSLTEHRRNVLDRADGMTLGYVSTVLLYDDKFRTWKPVDHKALLEAALAGYVKVYREFVHGVGPRYRLRTLA